MNRLILLLLAMLALGCVAPADDSRAIGVSRVGWLDNKVQGLADRSMDRARETILIPALQGMVDGLKNQQRSESAATHSMGVLMPEVGSEAKEAREVREVPQAKPAPQAVADQPDDVLTVRECAGNQCFGVFTIRRSNLAEIEKQAGFRGRKITILGVKRSVSVVVQPATVQSPPPVVVSSPAVTYSAYAAFSSTCTCDNCQCQRAAMLPNYSASAVVSYPVYTTTYRTRWRPFSRWR